MGYILKFELILWAYHLEYVIVDHEVVKHQTFILRILLELIVFCLLP
jgi:hypothetical protein